MVVYYATILLPVFSLQTYFLKSMSVPQQNGKLDIYIEIHIAYSVYFSM